MTDALNLHAYGYLTQPEVQFIDAAVARLIPADELGPGAKEAGVSFFIDQQLVSTWGTHGRNYRIGPWLEGTPQQGFQSRMTPQEIYRAGIRQTNIHCARQFDRIFAFLAADRQDEILHDLESGKIELGSPPSKLFFDLLWRNTEEGFFSDPMYGGNRDKAGWKLIGFPGVASGAYVQEAKVLDKPYRAEPVGILDVLQSRIKVDAQGYPKHVMLTRRDATLDEGIRDDAKRADAKTDDGH